jgi:cell division protease FtsH
LNDDEEDDQSLVPDSMDELYSQGRSRQRSLFENGTTGGFRIIIPGLGGIGLQFNQEGGDNEDDDRFYGSNSRNTKTKSDNFEVVKNHPVNFTHIGGYDNIKQELMQCVDLLSNYTRYHGYNVRVPKGLIFEGPPGNGKTLFAKALAGEAKVGFIAVSGSEFQEKYVGVGSSRIRELFKLAKENIPCIIFIDEIDAVGRKRAGDGETSSSERDSTLNELLVGLDGFKNSTGIFLIGATNRADLLDTALTRPGRVDKRIYIDNPDKKTRLAILNIHKRGKPMDPAIQLDDLVEQTSGYSAAQIENFLNEAMLNALRRGETRMYVKDIEEIANKMMVGWQPTEHQFTADIIDHIAVHEMGHAVVGMLCKHHSKVSKVLINLSAPNSPAYTIFENAGTPIMTREALLEHLMILLGGRIAEEVFYNVSVTTGAINDFEEALKLAEKMIVYYGMGDQVIYPSRSETYKEYIDDQVSALINEAYACAEFLLHNSRDLMYEGAEILKREKVLKADTLTELINNKHRSVLSLTAILAAKQPNHP